MAEKTAISWTDATFNGWWGCQKISPACDACYAERDSKRFAPGKVLWGVGSERRLFGDAHWGQPLKWAKTMPPKLGRRPRIFSMSMGDWLDLDAPLDQFVRLLDTIRLTPELDWQLLSKRIGNWRKRLDEAATATVGTGALNLWITQWLFARTPPANVWLGSTVIDQAEADRDIQKLLAVPARVRFLSIEPMLGAVDLSEWFPIENVSAAGWRRRTKFGEPDPDLHWVICGGESGPKARPMHPDWARSLREQCAEAGVAFHFKQWGEWKPCAQMPYSEKLATNKRHDMDDTYVRLDGTEHTILRDDHERYDVSDSLVRKVGKAAAGRLLDGRTHDEFPKVAGEPAAQLTKGE